VKRVLNDSLTNIVGYGQSLGAQYVEVRAQNLFKTILSTKEGKECGAAIRALIDGAWGFVSVGDLETKKLTEAVNDAVKLAKAASLHVKEPVKLADVKTVTDRVVAKPKKNPQDVSMEQKICDVLLMDKTVTGYDKRIKSCSISYLDVTGTDVFVNSDGTCIEQDKLYVWSRVMASAKQGTFFGIPARKQAPPQATNYLMLKRPKKSG
jgi:TldD protein